jgi:hypothetical protein
MIMGWAHFASASFPIADKYASRELSKTLASYNPYGLNGQYN